MATVDSPLLFIFSSFHRLHLRFTQVRFFCCCRFLFSPARFALGERKKRNRMTVYLVIFFPFSLFLIFIKQMNTHTYNTHKKRCGNAMCLIWFCVCDSQGEDNTLIWFFFSFCRLNVPFVIFEDQTKYQRLNRQNWNIVWIRVFFFFLHPKHSEIYSFDGKRTLWEDK